MERIETLVSTVKVMGETFAPDAPIVLELREDEAVTLASRLTEAFGKKIVQRGILAAKHS